MIDVTSGIHVFWNEQKRESDGIARQLNQGGFDFVVRNNVTLAIFATDEGVRDDVIFNIVRNLVVEIETEAFPIEDGFVNCVVIERTLDLS